MTSPSDELSERLLAALAQLPEGRAARLIDEAWDEAEAEIRGTVSAAMRAVLLRQVVAELEGTAAAATVQKQMPRKGQQPPPEAPHTRAQPATAMDASEGADDAHPARPRRSEPPAGGPEGCYVYGILERPIDLPGEVRGVDPDRPLGFVTAGGLAALVSRVATAEFGPDALRERLDDRAWLEDKVRRHEKVLREALRAPAMVPMRFCTIVRSEQDLAGFLAEHEEQLRSTLHRLVGKREYGVKVLIDRERFDAYVLEHSDEVQRLAADDTEHGSGAAYFVDKRRRQLIAEVGDRIAADRTHEWHGSLAAVASDAAELPLRRGDDEDGTQRMVLNGAYLVADGSWSRFSEVVDAIGSEGHPAGFVVDLTGPWPAYTFADTQVADDGAP